MQSFEKQRPLFRLSNQISLAIGGMILVFIALQGWMVVRLVQSSLEYRILQEREALATSIAAPIEAFLVEERDEMAHIFGFIEGEPAYDLHTGITLTLSRNPSLLEIVLVSPTGQVEAAGSNTNQILLGTPVALRQARWFLSAQAGEEYISTLYLSDENEPYIILSQPVTLSAYDGYILASRVDVRFLCETLHLYHLSTYEGIYILAGQNSSVAYSCYRDNQQWFTNPLPAALAQVNHPYLGRYRSAQHGDVLGASTLVSGTNWVIVNEISTATVLTDVRHIILTITLLFVMGALLLVSFARLLARLITQPMNELTLAVRAFEASGEHHPIKISSRSEIGTLTAAFNHMSQTITERERDLATANRHLKARSEELAELSHRTIAVEEEERRRVSRDLHDGLGQMLAALKMKVDVAHRLNDLTKIKAILTDSTHIAEKVLDEVHTIAQNLRPTTLDDLGLQAAIESHIHQFQLRVGLPVHYQLQAAALPPLTPEGNITAYRFLQEALNNIQKHAEANQVEVRIQQQIDYLMIVVKDDGKGFDRYNNPKQAGYIPLGLKGMQERLAMIGGELVIHSKPDEGTVLIALLPIERSLIL